METAFQEVHAHLEGQPWRQWSDLAIARTTPALLKLFNRLPISCTGNAP